MSQYFLSLRMICKGVSVSYSWGCVPLGSFLSRWPLVHMYCLPCGVVVSLSIVIRPFGWGKKTVGVIVCGIELIFVVFHSIGD